MINFLFTYDGLEEEFGIIYEQAIKTRMEAERTRILVQTYKNKMLRAWLDNIAYRLDN